MKLVNMLSLVGILNACTEPIDTIYDTGDFWDSEDWGEELWPETSCEELLDGREADSEEVLLEGLEKSGPKTNSMLYHLGRFKEGEVEEELKFLQPDGDISKQMYFCSTCSIYLNHVSPVFIREEEGIIYGLEMYLDESWYIGSYTNIAEGHEAVLTPSEESGIDYIVGETKKVFEFMNFSYEGRIEAEVMVTDTLFEAEIIPEEGPENILGNSNGYVKLDYKDGSSLEGCVSNPHFIPQTVISRFYGEQGFSEYR
ncbi:hypothetical protein HN681_02120 [archaeon]|jgi:hypothetical protein|nr:hypothetical protein [archaeon]MBT3731372.1 hypothetical protein [archaeon]MBT4670325.1 hypothetical protein [archaeon]MBT5029657.1 hypothetical protein [archaeon]MBT5287594.1 hypothetical protein [archaeon]